MSFMRTSETTTYYGNPQVEETKRQEATKEMETSRDKVPTTCYDATRRTPWAKGKHVLIMSSLLQSTDSTDVCTGTEKERVSGCLVLIHQFPGFVSLLALFARLLILWNWNHYTRQVYSLGKGLADWLAGWLSDDGPTYGDHSCRAHT